MMPEKPRVERLAAVDYLISVRSNMKRIAGKSIPDEKFCGVRAEAFLNGESNFELSFLEAAYVFNYLKVSSSFRNYVWLAHHVQFLTSV